MVRNGASPPASGPPRRGKKPNLDRPRKTVADVHGIPSSLDGGGGASAAQSGRAEMRDRLRKNTSASPALTSGDVDADWESAETVGDEAPGGDNPTPDQDVVDDIGRALGVEYEDDEELQGGAEIKERDRHRWELDPASKDETKTTNKRRAEIESARGQSRTSQISQALKPSGPLLATQSTRTSHRGTRPAPTARLRGQSPNTSLRRTAHVASAGKPSLTPTMP